MVRLQSRGQVHGAGFTLLEMIISLTILSLVLLTVYIAFSMGVDVWERMDRETSPEQRRAVTLRLLQEDFRSIRPYTWKGEDGEQSFFCGGPQSMFYATTNALGAAELEGKGLFFACLYVSQTQENGLGLYMYKTGLPRAGILDAVQDMRSMGENQRTGYVPPSALREKSILLLENLEEVVFAYQSQAYPLFSGAQAEVKSNRNRDMEDESLAQEEWIGDDMPGQILFRALEGDKSLLVHMVLASEPALNR